MGFRFLSPLLDLAWGSIPSPACDINRSLQPQGCARLCPLCLDCLHAAGWHNTSAGQRYPRPKSLSTTIMQALKSICEASKPHFWPS